jgi:hypothetical protein
MTEKEAVDRKKEFAREQVVFLKEKGITDKDQISRIFRCAGPGQVQEAYKLAASEDWTTPIGKVRRDLLDCLITGYGGAQDCGADRMRAVLQLAGFYAPSCVHERAFFQALDAALEILIPGSYEFDDEEESSPGHEKITLPIDQSGAQR